MPDAARRPFVEPTLVEEAELAQLTLTSSPTLTSRPRDR